MKPALTAEEWARLQIELVSGNIVQAHIPYIDYCPPEMVMQKIGAACLHGQPFGFTREDVALILAAAKEVNSSLRLWKDGREVGDQNTWGADDIEQLRSLADRIEALLPPEEE